MNVNRRYCGPCDEYTNANPCRDCGTETDKLPDPVCDHGTAVDVHCCNCHSGFLFDTDSCRCVFDEREKGDDDGREYADPRGRE